MFVLFVLVGCDLCCSACGFVAFGVCDCCLVLSVFCLLLMLYAGFALFTDMFDYILLC